MAVGSRVQQLEAMLVDAPDDAELRYFLAMEHVSAGATPAALEQFAILQAKHAAYVPAYVQQGQLLAKLGREAEARTVFTTGIAAAQRVGDLHAAGEMEAFLDSL